MIFLYFEDWSKFTDGRIIKVFASPDDPRGRLKNNAIKVVEVDDSPLYDTAFSYEKRGWLFGENIEREIDEFGELGKRTVRGLLRFSNREDLQFCQTGMKMKKGEDWLINNPLEDIEGLEIAFRSPETRGASIHLDIFHPDSLDRLSKIIDISPNSKELVDLNAGSRLKMEIQAEISTGKAERK